MLLLPESELAADNTSINIVEEIVTDSAPRSIVTDF